MKRTILPPLCAALLLAGCAGPGEIGMTAGGPAYYDGYYDGFYGPFTDGYWGDDGFFWYADGTHNWHRDDARHFRHDSGGSSWTHVHGSGVHREH